MSILAEATRTAIDKDLGNAIKGEFSQDIILFEKIEIVPSETIGFESEPGTLVGYKPHQVEGHFTKNFHSVDKEGFEKLSQTARIHLLDSAIEFPLLQKNLVQISDENYYIKSSELAGRGAKNYLLAKASVEMLGQLAQGIEYYNAHLAWLEANP